MTGEREVFVESYLLTRVEARGGLCIKLNAFWYTGIPDRIVLLPLAKIGFTELKRPVGGRRGTLQGWWREKLRELGFKCEFINTQRGVDDFLASL